jgi:ribosomal protein L11 methylase PrmA
LPGAPLILSGIIAPRKEDVIAAAAAVGFFVEREETENDWVALLVRRKA